MSGRRGRNDMTGRRMHRLETTAALLCFLTLSGIFAFRAIGVWLQPDRHAGWRLRVELSRMVTDLAQQLVKAGDIVRGQLDASWFFTRDIRINFSSPRVIVVYATMRGYPEQGY